MFEKLFVFMSVLIVQLHTSLGHHHTSVVFLNLEVTITQLLGCHLLTEAMWFFYNSLISKIKNLTDRNMLALNAEIYAATALSVKLNKYYIITNTWLGSGMYMGEGWE